MVNQREALWQSPKNLQIINAQLRDLLALFISLPADSSNFYLVMSDTFVTNALNKAAKIKKLNKLDNWVE